MLSLETNARSYGQCVEILVSIKDEEFAWEMLTFLRGTPLHG